MPVAIHRAGILPAGPGALTVDRPGVRDVLAAGQRAGETVVGASCVVADTNVGSGPGAGVAAGRTTLQTTLVDV